MVERGALHIIGSGAVKPAAVSLQATVVSKYTDTLPPTQLAWLNPKPYPDPNLIHFQGFISQLRLPVIAVCDHGAVFAEAVDLTLAQTQPQQHPVRYTLLAQKRSPCTCTKDDGVVY